MLKNCQGVASLSQLKTLLDAKQSLAFVGIGQSCRSPPIYLDMFCYVTSRDSQDKCPSSFGENYITKEKFLKKTKMFRLLAMLSFQLQKCFMRLQLHLIYFRPGLYPNLAGELATILTTLVGLERGYPFFIPHPTRRVWLSHYWNGWTSLKWW